MRSFAVLLGIVLIILGLSNIESNLTLGQSLIVAGLALSVLGFLARSITSAIFILVGLAIMVVSVLVMDWSTSAKVLAIFIGTIVIVLGSVST